MARGRMRVGGTLRVRGRLRVRYKKGNTKKRARASNPLEEESTQVRNLRTVQFGHCFYG